MQAKVNIAVTGVGSLIGQAIIKSIQRSDLESQINIIGFDYFNNTVGSFWIDKVCLLPDILHPAISEEQWIEALVQHIKENDIRLLLIGIDFELHLFSKHRAAIEAATGCIIVVSSPDVVTIADDKYLTYSFLKRQGLSHPASFLPGEFAAATLDYPVIVKPRNGARSIGVKKVKDQLELAQVLQATKDPVIQELVGSDEQEYTCGTIFLDGELKRMIVLQRSLKEGHTFISKYSKDFPASIYDYLHQVTSLLQPFGACNFQLRVDEAGVPKIFEINSRHSGTTYIRSLFGYKEIEYIINFLLFNKEIDFELREGKVVRYYEEFFTGLK